MRSFVNVFSGIAALAIQLAVSFFLSSYLVATVGEVANGFTQLANNFVSYASLITLAFNSMGSRFMATAYHRDDAGLASRYYSTLAVCNIVLCALFIPLAIYVVLNLQSIVSLGNANLLDVQVLFAFVFVNFFASMFVSLIFSATFVTNRTYIQNAVNLLRNALNAAVLLFVYSHFVSRVSYVSMVAFALTALSFPVGLIVKRKIMPEVVFKPKLFSWETLKALTSSGIWNTVNQCGHMMMTGLDLLLANWFVGPVAMGLLSVAKTVPSALSSLATTLNGNLEPALVISYAKNGTEGAFDRLKFDVKLSNYILSVPVAVFCAFAPAFYALWMPSLDSISLSVLSLLTLAAIIPWTGPQVLYNVFTATNKLKVNSVAFFISSVMNVLIVLVLVTHTSLGVYAIAGVSSLITIVRNLVVVAPYTARILGLKWHVFYKDATMSLCSCAVAYIIAILLQRLLYAGGWITFVVLGICSCALSWAALAFVVFNKKERLKVMALVKQMGRRFAIRSDD